jgi:glycosyltransferase involved in cell wall biosynthesis
VGGVAELFTPETDGLIVPAGSVEGFAVALRRLLDDAALRARLGTAARRTAEAALSLDAFARQCEASFERALERR